MKKNLLLFTNLAISGVILFGFWIMFTLNYKSMFKVVETDIEHLSVLSSESIYSRNSTMLATPINVGLTMANDTFLRDWLIAEKANIDNEEHIKRLLDYLQNYYKMYGYDSVAVTSEATLRYYHYSGIPRVLTSINSEDKWYFDFKNYPANYKLNIDRDKASAHEITIFVDSKVVDENGKILGVVGIGLRTDFVQKLLKEYEDKFNIKAYFIDKQGFVQVSPTSTLLEERNVFDTEALGKLKDKVLSNQETKQTFWTEQNGKSVCYVTQYVHNMKWYLVVEQDTSAINAAFDKELYRNLAILTIIAGLVVLLTTTLIHRYNSRILEVVSKDQLTGIRNRASYEEVLKMHNARLTLNSRVGMGYFAIGNMPQVNEAQGRYSGDNYIRYTARAICKAFPKAPVFRIGGDRFAALFEDMDADILEQGYARLCRNVERFNRKSPSPLTVSFGYAFYNPMQDQGLESVVARAGRHTRPCENGGTDPDDTTGTQNNTANTPHNETRNTTDAAA